MDVFIVAIWVMTLFFAIFSLIKNKSGTKEVSKKAVGMGRGMIKNLIVIILLIGLVLAYFPPTQIATFIEKQNLYIATVVSAFFGTITIIPAFIAFPLVGNLVDAQVGIVPAVAFLTTLTMVGLVTFPLEKKSFGLKFAVTRNVLSFVFAILIALIMGVLL